MIARDPYLGMPPNLGLSRLSPVGIVENPKPMTTHLTMISAKYHTRSWALGVALVTLTLAGCQDAATDSAKPVPPEAATQSSFVEASWKAPTEADIPNDPLGQSVKRGLYLLRFTPESLPEFATSNLRCTSCHRMDGLLPDAAPLTGSHARFPKYLPRTGAVIPLTDRVNYCFTRSLAGRALPSDSREMQDIIAYLAFISRGVPVGTKLAGADGLPPMTEKLVGDTTRGAAVFTRDCVVCHQANGEGNAAFPALWGAKSYSIGASMSREERAASFIYHNMPLTKPRSLTPQESFDVAAYINAQPRPDSPGKEQDWPTGGAPVDVPYGTSSGHEPHRPPTRLIPRRDPKRTLVPKPASVLPRATMD